MSANFAPPNPGTAKAPLNRLPQQPTLIRRFGAPILLAGLGLGLTYLFFATRAPVKPGTPPATPFQTAGVKNIEKAYSNGGATKTHTPTYGGTSMGKASSLDQDETFRDGAASGTQLKKGFE